MLTASRLRFTFTINMPFSNTGADTGSSPPTISSWELGSVSPMNIWKNSWVGEVTGRIMGGSGGMVSNDAIWEVLPSLPAISVART